MLWKWFEVLAMVGVASCQQQKDCLEQVLDLCALLHIQIWDMEALAGIPSDGKLLIGEVQKVVQSLIVDFAVGRPAPQFSRICAGCHSLVPRFTLEDILYIAGTFISLPRQTLI